MIFHLATLLFIALKLMHVIDWSWWLVFAPSILFLILAFLVPALAGVLVFKRVFKGF